MNKTRLNKKRVAIVILFPVLIIFLIIGCNNKDIDKNLMVNLINKSKEDAIKYCEENGLNYQVEEEYSKIKKDLVINQSINENNEINIGDNIILKISKGLDYESLKVNELGNIPVMMYHGIENITDNKYTGGNVDIDGYHRTASAFKKDLEFYYQSGYRMIRLNDYVNGIIDVDAGYSPIVLTFDDGLSNNIKVLGLDDNGDIIIDPNCAVGILEEFKKKYPDFNVTATFFINGGLFRQYNYNEKILNWLVDNGYDVGNHSYSHVYLNQTSKEETIKEIGSMYNLLEKYIPGKYVNIVALPSGLPDNPQHENFPFILKGNYNGKSYETISTLHVGWMYDESPFDKSFNKKFILRIRAWDADGKDWDIERNFNILKNDRYISDGDKNTITVKEGNKDKINNIYNLDIITY